MHVTVQACVYVHTQACVVCLHCGCTLVYVAVRVHTVSRVETSATMLPICCIAYLHTRAQSMRRWRVSMPQRRSRSEDSAPPWPLPTIRMMCCSTMRWRRRSYALAWSSTSICRAVSARMCDGEHACMQTGRLTDRLRKRWADEWMDGCMATKGQL